jgi:predicted amidohydrolase YtcJ
MVAPASLALTGGRVITLDSAFPVADTLLVHKDRIAQVGNRRALRQELGAAGEVIDLKGRTCLAGFIDPHVHFIATGMVHFLVDLTAARTLPEALARLRQAAAAAAPGVWVMAQGLAAGLLQGGERRMPDRGELDAVSVDRPIFVGERTGHACAANSRALEILAVPDSTNGLTRDSNGEPTGVFIAEANRLASDRADQHFAEQIGYERILAAASQEAAQAGLTTVHALDGALPADDPGVLAMLRRDPAAAPRILIYYQTRQVEAALNLGLPRIGGCSACALDGAFTPRTARLLEPYPDGAGGRGSLYFEDGELLEFFQAAHGAGLQICVHCVGDGAVEQALTAFERVLDALPRRDHRHRIEHAELITPAQIQRAKRLELAFSIQPAFNHFWRHDQFYPSVIGMDRAARVDPIRTLVESGLLIGAGSDSPVTPLRPLLGVHSAVNHSNRAERVDPLTALRLFTLNGARLGFEEHEKGSLTPGKLADLVVLGADPLQVDPGEIKDIPVELTIMGGRVVYSAD